MDLNNREGMAPKIEPTSPEALLHEFATANNETPPETHPAQGGGSAATKRGAKNVQKKLEPDFTNECDAGTGSDRFLEPADHVPTTPHGWDDDIQHGMMAHGVDLGFIRNEAPDELDDSSDDSAEDSDSDVPIRCVVCDLVEHNCDWRVGLL